MRVLLFPHPWQHLVVIGFLFMEKGRVQSSLYSTDVLIFGLFISERLSLSLYAYDTFKIFPSGSCLYFLPIFYWFPCLFLVDLQRSYLYVLDVKRLLVLEVAEVFSQPVPFLKSSELYWIKLLNFNADRCINSLCVRGPL